MQELQFLLAGVPGNVNIRDIGVDHLRTLFKELIDDIGYGFFISRDRCRGQDDRIAFFELYSLMLAGSDARQGDIGSPWLPVVMMTSLSSGMFFVIFRSTKVPAGIFR